MRILSPTAVLVLGLGSLSAMTLGSVASAQAEPDVFYGDPVSSSFNQQNSSHQESSSDQKVSSRYGSPQRLRQPERAQRLQVASNDGYGLNLRHEQATRRIVADPTSQAPGTITVNTHTRHLYLSLANGKAVQYGIGVGRQGFQWSGIAHIGRKAAWPDWTPPREMLKRRPDLPRHMRGGMENPLGARAMYLYKGDHDTMFRIHGTNEPETIGQAVSSGCIRMLNDDVVDLFGRAPVGTKVQVL